MLANMTACVADPRASTGLHGDTQFRMLFMIMQNFNDDKNKFDSLLQSMLDALDRYFNAHKFDRSGAPTKY